ncbi:MAG: hypothetical protein WBF48_11540 [Halarcobacter sp.]
MSEELKKEIISQVKNQVEKILTNSDADKTLKSLIYSGIENKYLSDINSKQTVVEDFFKKNKIELCALSIISEDDKKLFDRLYIIFFKDCKFYVRNLPLENKEIWFTECHFYELFIPSNCKQYGLIGTIFNKCHFYKGIYFGYEKIYDSNIFSDCEIDNKIIASKCTFNGKLFWNSVDNPYKNINELNMVNCIFKDNFIINEINREKNKEFIIKKLNLRDSTFFSKVKLFKCKINETSFYNTKFKDLADFYKSKFNGLFVDTLMEKRGLDYLELFEKTDFEGITVFSKSVFNCDINFKYTKFLDQTIFRETIVNKKFDLKDAIIKGSINFLDINNELKINISNRETARIIKNSFEQQNNIIEANKFYALEMKEREKEISPFKNLLEWLTFKIHGLASNHSQNWFLALFWIINLTFLTNFLSYEFSCENSTLHILDRSLFFIGGLFVFACGISKLKEKFINISLFIFSIFTYLIYINSYINDTNLNEFSNMINPFSIMTKGAELTFEILVYKIIIAYLIYQLIISIRQNTRRK